MRRSVISLRPVRRRRHRLREQRRPPRTSGTTSGGAPSAAGPGQTPPATEPPVSAKPGKPVVTTDGKKVHVEGVGVGNSDKFDLTRQLR